MMFNFKSKKNAISKQPIGLSIFAASSFLLLENTNCMESNRNFLNKDIKNHDKKGEMGDVANKREDVLNHPFVYSPTQFDSSDIFAIKFDGEKSYFFAKNGMWTQSNILIDKIQDLDKEYPDLKSLLFSDVLFDNDKLNKIYRFVTSTNLLLLTIDGCKFKSQKDIEKLVEIINVCPDLKALKIHIYNESPETIEKLLEVISGCTKLEQISLAFSHISLGCLDAICQIFLENSEKLQKISLAWGNARAEEVEQTRGKIYKKLITNINQCDQIKSLSLVFPGIESEDAEQLIESLPQCEAINGKITNFKICLNSDITKSKKLSAKCTPALAKVVKNLTNVEKLFLNNINADTETFYRVLDSLSYCHALENLSLAGNIINKDSAEQIVKVFTQNVELGDKLYFISLKRCDISSENFGIISTGLQKFQNLKYIDFGYNNISDVIAVSPLAKCSGVKYINLAGNKISAKVVHNIVEALSSNMSLKGIGFLNNGFGNTEEESLRLRSAEEIVTNRNSTINQKEGDEFLRLHGLWKASGTKNTTKDQNGG